MNKFMRKLWKKKDCKKGFTLVELIVVLVILGIMAAILIPSMVGWLNKAKERQHVLEARAIMTSTQVWVTENVADGTYIPGDATKGLPATVPNADISDIQDMAGVTITSITGINYTGATTETTATINGMTVAFTSGSNAEPVTYKLEQGTWTKQ